MRRSACSSQETRRTMQQTAWARRPPHGQQQLCMHTCMLLLPLLLLPLLLPVAPACAAPVLRQLHAVPAFISDQSDSENGAAMQSSTSLRQLVTLNFTALQPPLRAVHLTLALPPAFFIGDGSGAESTLAVYAGDARCEGPRLLLVRSADSAAPLANTSSLRSLILPYSMLTVEFSSTDAASSSVRAHFALNVTGMTVCPGGFQLSPWAGDASAGNAPLCVATPPPFVRSSAVHRGVVAFNLVVLALEASFAAVIIHFRRSFVFRSSAPVFSLLMLAGLALLPLGGVAWSSSPLRSADGGFICGARVWTVALGVATILSSLVLKTDRIRRIFVDMQLKRESLRDSALLKVMGAIVAIQVILLAAFSGAELSTPEQSVVGVVQERSTANGGSADDALFSSAAYSVWGCSASRGTVAWFIIELLFLLVLLGACMLMAFRTRHVPSSYSESFWIMGASIQILLFALVLLPLQLALSTGAAGSSPTPDQTALVTGSGLGLLSLTMFLQLFGSKVFYLLMKQHDRKAEEGNLVIDALTGEVTLSHRRPTATAGGGAGGGGGGGRSQNNSVVGGGEGGKSKSGLVRTQSLVHTTALTVGSPATTTALASDGGGCNPSRRGRPSISKRAASQGSALGENADEPSQQGAQVALPGMASSSSVGATGTSVGAGVATPRHGFFHSQRRVVVANAPPELLVSARRSVQGPPSAPDLAMGSPSSAALTHQRSFTSMRAHRRNNSASAVALAGVNSRYRMDQDSLSEVHEGTVGTDEGVPSTSNARSLTLARQKRRSTGGAPASSLPALLPRAPITAESATRSSVAMVSSPPVPMRAFSPSPAEQQRRLRAARSMTLLEGADEGSLAKPQPPLSVSLTSVQAAQPSPAPSPSSPSVTGSPTAAAAGDASSSAAGLVLPPRRAAVAPVRSEDSPEMDAHHLVTQPPPFETLAPNAWLTNIDDGSECDTIESLA